MKVLTRIRKRNKAAASTDLAVATPDWEEAAYTVTVVDVDEFEAAHDDPEWLAFCESADEYVDKVTRELGVAS